MDENEREVRLEQAQAPGEEALPEQAAPQAPEEKKGPPKQKGEKRPKQKREKPQKPPKAGEEKPPKAPREKRPKPPRKKSPKELWGDPRFEQYAQALPESDRALLTEFFAQLSAHISLGTKAKRAMLRDFEAAFVCYAGRGTPLPEALGRLSVRNLGGFYARPPILWYPLDDAAKIYPLSMGHNRMAVFRLSVYLRQAVVPELLQIALTFTIRRFPSFATTVKNGFFWNYLDTAKRRYAAEPEDDLPCRPLDVSLSGSQSFRVLYHNDRISVEFFHILTDGTGGMVFLKTLTAEYLRLCGTRVPSGGGVLDTGEAPSAREAANDFPQAEKTDRSAGFLDRPAVQMSGRLSRVKPCRVLHFLLDAGKLKAAAESCGATVTAYLLALLFVAGRRATDELSGEINIQVPVNMRKFYPSETLRNFALYCGVRLPLAAITDPRAILPEITDQLARKASRPAMNEMMNATVGMVRALRYVPLFIKRPAARAVYGYLGDRIFSNTLSNLGVVRLPPEMAAQVRHFDFVLGTAVTNRAACALVTFGGTAVLTVTKLTADPSFEEELYALLERDGLRPEVEGSELYES